MITVSSLTKGFGSRDLFSDAELFVAARDRVAIVGPNGTGKTTLLEMIAGQQAPDEGVVKVLAGAIVGYLEQETDALRGRSVLEEVLSVGSEATQAGHRLEVLGHEIAETPAGPEQDALIEEYGRLQHRFESLGGYSLEAEAKRIMAGLGFTDADHSRPTDALSGGWLMRVALAKLLLSGPDILMLDEPTNHLDVNSVEWLEGFLKSYEGCVLLISHDRDFIEGIATRVVEIDNAKLVSYTGGYSDFVEQRALRMEQAEAENRNRSKKVAETQAFIDRFRYKASKAKQVQSRIKMLERMDQGSEAPAAPARRWGFVSRRHLARAGTSCPRRHLVRVHARRAERLRASRTRHRARSEGRARGTERRRQVDVAQTRRRRTRSRPPENDSLGHNVNLAYFAQHQIEALDPNNRVIEELSRAIPPKIEIKPRDLLGRFLFSGDDTDKKVAVLSGGERTRLALAKMLVTPANMLCLDEPTNHLDIQSRDVLEDALVEYSGSMLLITHDRHLIRSVADLIFEVVAGKVKVHHSGYERYLEMREPEVTSSGPVSAPDVPEGPVLSAKEKRKLAAEQRAKTKVFRDKVSAIETKLDRLTTERSRIEGVLGDPEAYTRGEDIGALSRDYERTKKRIATLEAEWEAASAELEAASD